jgi:hypothetical protein
MSYIILVTNMIRSLEYSVCCSLVLICFLLANGVPRPVEPQWVSDMFIPLVYLVREAAFAEGIISAECIKVSRVILLWHFPSLSATSTIPVVSLVRLGFLTHAYPNCTVTGAGEHIRQIRPTAAT